MEKASAPSDISAFACIIGDMETCIALKLRLCQSFPLLYEIGEYPVCFLKNEEK